MSLELIPIQTRKLLPPKDDLFEALDKALPKLEESDIVLVTSKVVAIHRGLCVPVGEVERDVLVKQEADQSLLIDHAHGSSLLTLKHHALFFRAGIDESNGNGYYILLPRDPFADARSIYEHLRARHGLRDVGVIITDSHTLPMRYGVTSIAIGFWGMEPVNSHKGKKDLFGRELLLSATNLIDSLAAGSSVVGGEADESTPVVIARGVPNVRFSDADLREDFLVPPKEDLYYELFKRFYDEK